MGASVVASEPCRADSAAGASFRAAFFGAFAGELRVDSLPEVAPHAARRPIAASRLRGSGSSEPSAFAAFPADVSADATAASTGSSPVCSIQRATDAATSGAGARRRRTPLGSARIASVSRSSRMPGTSQSVPASLTRSSTSIGMRIDTPSRGLPGANS